MGTGLAAGEVYPKFGVAARFAMCASRFANVSIVTTLVRAR